jgi:TonB family protein
MSGSALSRLLGAAAISALVLATPLSAQTSTPLLDSTSRDADAPCDSSAIKTPVRSGSVIISVALHGSPWVRVPKSYAELLLEEIASRVALPTPLFLPVFGGAPDAVGRRDRAKLTAPTAALQFRLTLRRDGSLVWLDQTQRSLSPALDGALENAIRQADSARTLPPVPKELRGDTVVMFITLSAGDKAEAGARPIARAQVPVVRLTSPVRPRSGNPPYRYPQALRMAGVTGEVLLQFVVDQSGRPVPGTYRIVSASHAEFAAALLEVLPTHRFTPARVGDCPVMQLVQAPFSFNLSR